MAFQNLLSCFCCALENPSHSSPHPIEPYRYTVIDEKPPVHPASSPRATVISKSADQVDKTAAEVVAILRRAEKAGPGLVQQLDDAVSAEGWSEWLAERVLHALEETLKHTGRETWGEVLSDAYDAAVAAAEELFSDLVAYAKEHPYEIAASILLSLVAFGVMARLMPWVLRLLGFGIEGPIEGTFASWFQSTYRGYVPKGSIMSFLQRLGMTWRKA
ncbi:putative HTH-type transcriptional regulator YdfL [Madurella mycetomatis]|uniref:HTH-type transcriptional regulator YdfL n=1 Tax=Madurella mycetomatis TaxID=100816 RepID=A0A175WBI2_9PEZI|nr:putative HTH-type transcriptional regulator YdfL [Madurella mycetomatis]